MMRPAQAWQILGIASGSDVATVKRAYAEKLKAIDPDQEVEAFLHLRAAFEHDTGRNAFTLLTVLLPIVGLLILLYFLFEASQPEANQFGPPPR